MRIGALRRYLRVYLKSLIPAPGSIPIRLIVFATLINVAFIFGSMRGTEGVNQEGQQQRNVERYEHRDQKRQPEGFWTLILNHPVEASTILIALFNALLVYVTYRLVRSTNRLWEAGERQIEIAKLSADAAKAAADALPILERARLYINISDHTIMASAQVVSDPFEVRFFFTNYGKTPAVIIEISYGSYVARVPQDDIVYTVHPEPLSSDFIGSREETDVIVYYGRTGLATAFDATKLATGEVNVWFYGKVDYADVFGGQHIHRFLRRCVTVGGKGWLGGKNFRFQAYDNKHYNESV